MASTFEIELNGNEETLFLRAKRAAVEAGGELTGDTQQGTFLGRGVKGRYQRVGKKLIVTVDEKPWLVPLALVQSQVKAFFAN